MSEKSVQLSEKTLIKVRFLASGQFKRETIAKEAGVQCSTVCLALNKNNVTAKTWLKIGEALGCRHMIAEELYDLNTIGGRLKYIRNSLMEPNLKVSKNVGIRKDTLSKWENGLSTPSIEHIVKLSNYFGCTTDYILKGGRIDGIKR